MQAAFNVVFCFLTSYVSEGVLRDEKLDWMAIAYVDSATSLVIVHSGTDMNALKSTLLVR